MSVLIKKLYMENIVKGSVKIALAIAIVIVAKKIA